MSSVLQDLNSNFSSWDDLVALSTESAGQALPDDVSSRVTRLEREIESWESIERESEGQLLQISSSLPTLLSTTLSSLQSLQEQAKSLSQERSGLLQDLDKLEIELVGIVEEGREVEGGEDGAMDVDKQDQTEDASEAGSVSTSKGRERSCTLSYQLQSLQSRMESLQAGLRWMTVLSGVVELAQTAINTEPATTLNPSQTTSLSHFLPKFRMLHSLVASLQAALPPEMALHGLVREVENGCWEEMRRVLGSRLMRSLSVIGWPKVISYPAVPVVTRRAFERSFRDMLLFQAEGEKLAGTAPASQSEICASRLYPFDVMVEPIEARFRFHFEGERNTNRLDKPEWAFSHILDLVFEQKEFLDDYLQPLLRRCGFGQVDAKSEFVNALLPLPLKLLQHRFPHLLSHPALLAHTIYQSVQFDDAIRDSGFTIASIWSRQRGDVGGPEAASEWRGITEEVLKRDGWYTRWLDGEKQFADDRYQSSMSAHNAGDLLKVDSQEKAGTVITVAASQVKLLLEQVTDRYSPLPNIEYKYPFLSDIQVQILDAFLSKFSTSLDAFENLAAALLRVVPGALAGHATHAGLTMDPAKVTTGFAGLGRLCTAWISLSSLLEAMRKWDDDAVGLERISSMVPPANSTTSEQVFVSLIAEIEAKPQVRRPSDDYLFGPTVFSLLIDRYQAAVDRAEDMIVKHVSGEVERDLRVHLTRRWDTPAPNDGTAVSIDPALISPLTTFSGQLGFISQRTGGSAIIRLYRRIASHISNHVMQRAVYAGWSKFTVAGGQEFQAGVNAWIDASRMALGSSTVIKRPEGPWAPLMETAQILRLPTSLTSPGEIDLKHMADLVAGNDMNQVRGKLSLRTLSDETITAVMRRRIDYTR